jgi:hypothetical protein
MSQNYLMINLVDYKNVFMLGPAAKKITSRKVPCGSCGTAGMVK